MKAYRLLALLWLPLLTGCGEHEWGWYVIDPSTDQGWINLKFLVGGLGDTLAVSLLSMLLAMLLGLAVTLPAFSQHRSLRWFNRSYVEVVRAIPVLVLLLWVYYGLPTLFEISLNHFWAGVITLTLAESAFMAELFRAGIQGIHQGQHEAADALGLTYWQKMRLVIFPQALRQILPPLGNQFVYILKMSSLVSVIGLGDLTRRANELVTNEYLPLEIYSFLVLEYLLLILCVSYAVRWMERKLAYPH